MSRRVYMFHCMLQYILFIMKNVVVVEAWCLDVDDKATTTVHTIDNFTITLRGTFERFDQSNSRTLKGENGTATLTLRIGNLTAEKGKCSFYYIDQLHGFATLLEVDICYRTLLFVYLFIYSLIYLFVYLYVMKIQQNFF